MIEASRRSACLRALHALGRFVLFLLPVAVVVDALPTEAGERIALVIGNGAYRKAPPLAHVGSDTAVIADTLRSLDFDVEPLNDLDQAAMQEHIEAFASRIDQAGKDAIGLLFYSGHGFQLDGSNYLLPVDADISKPSDVELAAIDLDLTLAEIAFAANDHKLVILDVPVDQTIGEDLGVTPGLAAIDAPVGTLVAFGGLPGAGAESPRHHGLYPLALVNVMAKPGLTVEQVFQDVRLGVAAATDGLQIPWESSALVSPLYLAGRPDADSDGVVGDHAKQGANGLAAVDPRMLDFVAWTRIQESDRASDFAGYLEAFPEGVFRTPAAARLQALDDAEAPPAAALDPKPRFEALEERLITQKRAHLRAEPSSSSLIVATLEPNQAVDVTGAAVEGDWLRVRLGADVEAFMWGPILGETPPPAGMQTAFGAVLPPSKDAILGQWRGEYQCQWDSIGFTLNITDQDADAEDAIGAVFSFFPSTEGPAQPAGSFAMSGDYDPADGTIILKSGDWIERPRGLQRHDLAGRAEIGGAAISGRIETSGCSDFYLARGDDRGQSTVQSATQ